VQAVKNAKTRCHRKPHHGNGATASSFALPRDPLTKITGKPNFAAATKLHKELFESATSVCSAQGGQRGHLSAAAPAARCNAMETMASNPGTEKNPKFDLLSHCRDTELPKLEQIAIRVRTATGKRATVRCQKGSAVRALAGL
jgi:hypothetical protein